MSTGAFFVIVVGTLTVGVISSVFGFGAKTNPVVSREKHVLLARTSAMRRGLSLFAHYFEVQVNGKTGWVSLKQRRFWIFSTNRMIPVKQVAWVDYRFLGELNPQSETETYRVSLALRDGETLPLFDFAGSANVGLLKGARNYNPLTHTYEGDGEFQQIQALESRGFIESLCELLRAPLGDPAVKAATDAVSSGHCESCKRPGRGTKCLYCGGGMVESTTPAPF